ncbi:hypothetical protein BCT41_24665 [Vibrio splendidus]|uniref:hypothetical protein n=1 Tax=Vibrio TaxID=662 RepID=UPI000C834841|nr:MULTISPECIES: hypothetical protein [Vibrio]PMK90732.1 hypothetical protein BCT89_03015 [Vibrio lentus]PMN14456.1 hypothetical protein BCT41_24665 [Vibrio splendidus]TKF03658.1 hypothetical protein FCV46_12390 [Vibrio kanaloae]TKF64540.1 hypothetical protein FCV51_03285 [Vibrio kanaloae]
MSETTNTAKMAELVSSEIFKFFKWERRKSKDRNWSCASPEVHKTQAGTHPSDVVFYYQHPYLGEDIYVNTDLKSYAKDTIKTNKIATAITSLAKATHCANHSKSFAKKYLHTDEQLDVVGMLFVYNHCGEYDRDFDKLLRTIPHEDLALGEHNKLYVLSPEKIRKIFDITNDISRLISKDALPKPSKYSFLYPDLVLTKNRLGDSEPATLEMILSDTLIIKHEYDEDENILSGYVVYYSKEDPRIEDFIYLLDSFSHYQMLDKGKPIKIRYTKKEYDEDDLANKFEAAITKYSAIWGKKKQELEKKVTFNIISTFSPHFSQSVIGMGDEEN